MISKEDVREVLECAGQEINAKGIAKICGHNVTHDTAPGVRVAIRELIEDGVPVGANAKGYFLIKDKHILDDYLESLQSRCDAIQKRIANVTSAYNSVRNSRHLDKSYSLKDRCRMYVIYLAESAGIPYQAIWSLAYRRFEKTTGISTTNLPDWYNGSVLNFINNKGKALELYACLCKLEEII